MCMLRDTTMFKKLQSVKLKVEKEIWQSSTGVCFEVTLRRSNRSRHVKISIGQHGEIVVSGPSRVSKSFLYEVLKEKESWLLRSFENLKQAGQLRDKDKEQELYQKHKEQARKLVQEKLLYWNQYYHYTYRRVSIRNQRTRWGSCSRLGTLNFHFRIVFLPEELVDYLIVHELCHLKAFDHSQRFWKLVQETIPVYERRRQILKKSPL